MLKITLTSWWEEWVTVIQSKTDPDYRTHTLRETILFVFSKIYTVIVFVLLSCLLCLSKEVIRILKCNEDN